MARATRRRPRPARPSCSDSRRPAPISLGKLAMTQLAWGMMGQTPGRPTVPQPARPGARARRLVVGLGRGRRDGHRRPRARHRRRRQRAASGRGLRRRRVQADLRLGPARRLHAVRAELRHRRRDRAQRRRGGAAVRRPRRHAAGRARAAASTACASHSSAATSRRRSRTTSRRCSSSRAGACARVRWTSPGRRTTTARCRRSSPRSPARSCSSTTRSPTRRSTTRRPRRRRGVADAAGDRVPAGPRELAEAQRRCAAAAAGYDILLCASAPCPPVPIDGPDKTTRMNALTKPFNALGWPALSLPGRRRPRRPAARPAGRRAPGSDAVVLRAAAALEAPASGLERPERRAAIAARLRSTSSSVVAHDDTLMRIAVRPCQTVPPHQHVPSACTPATTRSRLRGLAERDEHLVEHDVVEDLVARRGEALGEARGMPAVALDEVVEARAAERAQRRPDLDAARAARELGRVVGRIAHAGSAPAGTRPSRPSPARRASASRTNARPLSYGTFSHLCASVAHESARPSPRRRCARRARGRGPQAERAVDVQPRPGLARALRRSRRAGRTRPC